MSINRLVSVDNVIVDLMDDLGLDHDKYRPMFTNWAVRAEKKIGSFYQYKRKHAVLTISGCVAEIPCEAVYLQLALMGDYGCDCGDLFRHVCSNIGITIGSDTSFLVIDIPTSGNFYALRDHHVQDNKIIFSSNLDGQKVTIQYLGIESDENGISLIGENHIEAIGEYCQWKFKRRRVKDWMQQKMIGDHEKQWHILCADARAEDAEISESERQRIVGMLHDPLVGRGLPLHSSWGNL